MTYTRIAATWILFALIVAVVTSSGCITSTSKQSNMSQNISFENSTHPAHMNIKKDFVFELYKESNIWVKRGKRAIVYAVFNNVDEDGQAHKFVSKVIPFAADFDVYSAYQCLHFVECKRLKADMLNFIHQLKEPVEVNYTFVGLSQITIEIPQDAVEGTYMYNVVACKDIDFDECNEATTNWGPTLPLVIHVF
ncbi:MAG: hypothetical protein J7K72_00790 [Candidatus Aenigmarchaeota archaeon]|nr:hypothetical protein [Candidatus Aenigmarchaeota archaeon]